MHLAYLYSRYPVASQTFCDSEMMALERADVRVSIGSINPPNTTFRHERLRDLRAPVHYPPPPEVLKRPLFAEPKDPVWEKMEKLAVEHDAAYGESFKAATRARNGYYFAKKFAALGVDHVHVHFANRATHTALFIREAGIPFSFTAHAQDFMVDLGSDDLLREMIEKAAFVVAVSDYSRGLLVKICPSAEEKIIRVYNGIDPGVFPAATGSGRPLHILSVGRLIEFKGFHHLIGAVAELRKRGVEATLDIVGDGPWQERLEKQIIELGLGEAVALRGLLTQEEIKSALAASDVFALGCIIDEKGASDILPTVIMEAMACSLPIVSTKLVGVPEMVVDGETGFLADPGDESGLADALEKLAGDPALRKTLGAAGRKLAGERFSLDVTGAQIGELFSGHIRDEHDATATPTVRCLMNEWSAEAADKQSHEARIFLGQNVAVLCGGVSDPFKAERHIADLPGEIDFLPDAMVLEAAWRHDPAAAEKLTALRTRLGYGLSGELFFTQARRALHTAATFGHTTHVHAMRSDSVLWAWMVQHLTGCRASYAIEPRPVIPRSVLEKILPDFAFGSIGDSRLREKLNGSDALALSDDEAAMRTTIFRRPKSPADVNADRVEVINKWATRSVLPHNAHRCRHPLLQPRVLHREGLDSVLAQTRRPDRIVVIDDGSKDDSVAVMQPNADRGEIELTVQENAGAHETINRAIAKAATDCDVISILNSDDHYLPQRLEKCAAYLEANPDKSVVCTHLQIIDDEDNPLSLDEARAKWFRAIWSIADDPDIDFCEWMGIANFPATTSNVVARAAFFRKHPFKPYRFNHDYYFLSSAVLKDQFHLLEGKLVNYRVHANNTINTNPAPLLREMLRMHLDLYHDLAPQLKTDAAIRSLLYRYMRSAWDNVSSFHAGLFQIGLAEIASRVSTDDIEEIVTGLDEATFPELADYPNKALVNQYGGEGSMLGSSGLAEKYEALKKERSALKDSGRRQRPCPTAAEAARLALGCAGEISGLCSAPSAIAERHPPRSWRI